jgi:hypothetical protein
MKQIILPLLSVLLLVTSCNNNKTTATHKESKTMVDSLYDDVMDGHDVGMGKMARLNHMQQQTKHLLDSITKLPVKAQQAATPYKAKLDSLLKDLDYADFAMNKWMEEFSLDSAKNNVQQRIKYLSDEKDKVGKVKSAILNSLEKADSLFKSKL